MISEFPLIASARSAVARRFRDNRSAIVALALLLAIVVPCAFAPIFAPYDPAAQPELLHHSQPPSVMHPFGTDQFSRDIFSRVLYGGRL
jgi:peptide/nickel transport system permease protein